jgi:hypothetical protein
VKGDLNVENLVVYGKIQKNIKTRSLGIRASGKVECDTFKCKSLLWKRVQIYNGKCSMRSGRI